MQTLGQRKDFLPREEMVLCPVNLFPKLTVQRSLQRIQVQKRLRGQQNYRIPTSVSVQITKNANMSVGLHGYGLKKQGGMTYWAPNFDLWQERVWEVPFPEKLCPG